MFDEGAKRLFLQNETEAFKRTEAAHRKILEITEALPYCAANLESVKAHGYNSDGIVKFTGNSLFGDLEPLLELLPAVPCVISNGETKAIQPNTSLSEKNRSAVTEIYPVVLRNSFNQIGHSIDYIVKWWTILASHMVEIQVAKCKFNLMPEKALFTRKSLPFLTGELVYWEKQDSHFGTYSLSETLDEWEAAWTSFITKLPSNSRRLAFQVKGSVQRMKNSGIPVSHDGLLDGLNLNMTMAEWFEAEIQSIINFACITEGLFKLGKDSD